MWDFFVKIMVMEKSNRVKSKSTKVVGILLDFIQLISWLFARQQAIELVQSTKTLVAYIPLSPSSFLEVAARYR